MSARRPHAPTDPAGRDRRDVTAWVTAAAALVGIWVLAPLVSTLWALAAQGTVSTHLSPPRNLPAADGVEVTALAARVPADALGSGARTALLSGTVMEVIAVLVMLVAVTVVMRSLRPGSVLSTTVKSASIAATVLAGILGLIGANIVASAGALACSDVYTVCAGTREWDDPLANAFPLAGIALALVFALVRSETIARHEAEGLV